MRLEADPGHRPGRIGAIAMLAGALVAGLPAAAPAIAPAKASGLLWPLDRPKEIVSTFGEYRYDRLHAGLDLSTDGAVGLPVKAVGDGEIYRLKVEWRGYGRALYLRLRDGRRIVYGHLERYEDKALGLEKRVARRREESGNRFPGDVFLEPGIPVRRGQVVAYSGESGVGPPHLHVEVRDADDHPIDPFTAGLPRPPAGAAPVLESLTLTAAAPQVFIDGRAREVTLDLRRPSPGVVVGGPFEASVSAWDPTGGGRAGLSDLEVLVDGVSWYHFEPRRFGFSEGPVAGLLFDHRRSRLGPARFSYRLSLQPGNNLATGSTEARRALSAPVSEASETVPGAFDLPAGEHLLEIRARAVGGAERRTKVAVNVAPPKEASGTGDLATIPYASLHVEALPRFFDIWIGGGAAGSPLPAAASSGSDALVAHILWQTFKDGTSHVGVSYPFARTNIEGWNRAIQSVLGAASIDWVTREEGVRRDLDGSFVDLPEKARFFTGPLVIRQVAVDTAPVGLVPLAKAVDLLPAGESLDAPGRVGFLLPATGAAPERCGIYRQDPDSGRWGYEGDRLESGAIVQTFRRYGRFALLQDDAPPSLSEVLPGPGRTVGARPTFSARVSDVGKGLNWDGVRFGVDGRPLVSEYDPDRGVARVVETTSLAAGRHRLTVTVIDRAGNVAPPVEHEFIVRGTPGKSGR